MAIGIEQAMTRHQVQLQRVAGGNYRLVVPVLKEMSNDLKRMINSELDPEILKTLRVVQAETKQIIDSTVKEMTEILETEYEELAVYESGFVKSIYDAIEVEMDSATLDKLNKVISKSRMLLYDQKGSAQRLTINEAFKQFNDTAIQDVNRRILGGIGSSRTTSQIANDVYRMTNNRTQNQAEALVRTTTNHVASVARESFYKENDEVIKGERYTATLDNRTSFICITNDGKLFKIGEGLQTPAHWNCRSIRIAEVYSKYKIPGLSETRSSIDGPVSTKTTYEDFLRKQDNDFQNEVLGPKRAELFREGKVKISQFTDFGRVLTIKELESKYL